MTKGTQNLGYSPGATKYYTNCRGVNYVPIMYSEWEKSGFMPRLSKEDLKIIGVDSFQVPGYGYGSSELYGFESSSTFLGANKTSQWWYYNSEDNNKCLQMIRDAGINAIRVFTNIYVWNKNKEKYLKDTKDFMRLCEKHKIRVQLVIFDSTYVPQGSQLMEPGSDFSVTGTGSATQLYTDPVYFGLAQSWNRIPFEYQVSSQSAAQNFYNNSAVPFINDLCSSLSSFQSFWSFDLANETDSSSRPHLFSEVIVSSSYLISSLLSSINVGITFGNGDTFRFYSGTLTGGPNNGSPYPLYPSDLIQFSSSYNFASIHPYITNSKMVAERYVDEAVSASKIIGRPSMYNEGGAPPNTFYKDIIEWMNDGKNYGGMVWQGLIDLGLTHLPFASVQGLFHWDGTTRRSDDAESYSELALKHGWLKKSQLKLKFEQKENSINIQKDSGYYSATIPWHERYDSDLHVSTTQEKWNFIAAAVYNAPVLNALGAVLSSTLDFVTKSKNYVPYYDKNPYSPLITSYVSDGVDLVDYISACRNYKTYFRSFSSILIDNSISENQIIPSTSSGPIYKQLNEQAVKKMFVLERCFQFIMNIWEPIPQAYLIGSQYDYLPASALRLQASGHLWQYLRGLNNEQGYGDGSSIQIWSDNENLDNISSTKFWASGTGYYITPGTNTTPDWWKYDEWFDTAFDYVNGYLDVLEEAAKTNDFYRLY